MTHPTHGQNREEHQGAATEVTTTAVSAEELAADRLAEAERSGTPCRPVREILTGNDLATGYRVQSILTARSVAAGRRPIGRKIGLTSIAVQQQLGVATPDIGVLYSDMAIRDGGTVPFGRLLQPRVEAEVAFMLAADLEGDVTLERARAAIGWAAPAIEIVDSRIASWDISLVDTVADNASSGLYVLGSPTTDPAGFDFAAVTMTLVDNAGTVFSAGTGADCLGDPVNALLWLARAAQDLESPLRRGEIVLSGALGPMVGATPGSRFEARLSRLGSVAVGFEEA